MDQTQQTTSQATEWNAVPDDEFKFRIREFVEKNLPRELRHLVERQRFAVLKPWMMTLSRAGMLAPAWPREYGGMGLNARKHMMFLEELERGGSPMLLEQGLNNVGPVLIMYGSESQKQHYLPKILSNEYIWCQGYSEPNAGSDLASVRTEGRVEGDELIINGRKIWTSMAFDASHMIALIRTAKTAKKHAGLTLVLIDMNQAGFSVRPIKGLGGEEEFCEVTLDDVRAKLSDVVGEVNGGWRPAVGLLGSERLWLGSPRHSLRALSRLEKIATARGQFQDAAFEDRYAQLLLDVLDLGSTYERMVEALSSGKPYGHEANLLKLWQSETYQRVNELTLEAAGSAGATSGEIEFGEAVLDILTPFYESRQPTIYGGSVQIQRNILSKNVLKLPN
jgi:alkylation response protein AidB-like acyl-CoA dehydrogenase